MSKHIIIRIEAMIAETFLEHLIKNPYQNGTTIALIGALDSALKDKSGSVTIDSKNISAFVGDAAE